jgi:hypothetical protein
LHVQGRVGRKMGGDVSDALNEKDVESTSDDVRQEPEEVCAVVCTPRSWVRVRVRVRSANSYGQVTCNISRFILDLWFHVSEKCFFFAILIGCSHVFSN